MGICKDCGKPCPNKKALRCRECWKKDRAKCKTPPFSFCIDCGKPLFHKESKRCRQCFYKYMSNLPASEYPGWKGGRYKSGDYFVIHYPEHPRASVKGVVFEHRLVWEQTHNKLLPEGWIVHHLNGIKTDNRPSNLVALPNKKHALVLVAKAKRIQELEAFINHQQQLL